MKITGHRTLTTHLDWGRSRGDANGYDEHAVTEVSILIVETDEGVEGVGMCPHADAARVLPAMKGQDPRSVAGLYDRMLAYVFKSGHQGATFGSIAAFDSALWDIKAKLAGEPLWRLPGSRQL